MADTAIQVTPYTQANPLTNLNGIQQFLNAQEQNKLIQSNTALTNTQNQQGQTNLNNQNSANYFRAAYGLKSLPDDQRMGAAGLANVTRTADEMLSQNPGPNSANVHQQVIASLPPPIGPDGKPTDYTPWIDQHYYSAASNFSGPELARLLGNSPVTIDNGQQIQGGTQAGPGAPNAGQLNMQPGGANNGSPTGVQKQTGPETNASINQIWDPEKRAFVPVPRSTLPGASGSVGGNAKIPGTGAYTPQAANTPTTSAPLGTAETVAANQHQYQTDVSGIPDAQQRIANLTEAHKALQALATSSPGSVGIGADRINTLKQIMGKLGLGSDETMKNINNYAEANKYFIQNATSLPSVRSDSSLEATLHGQPSTNLPPDAALDVTKQIIGRERQRIAQATSAPDKTGIGYQNYSATFANNNDRRAFAWDLYSPAQQKEIIGSLKGNDLTKFQRSLGVASRLGLINLPQAAPTQ